MTESLVQASGLRVELQSRTLIDGVSLVAAQGNITVIVGPNGAGKTTLLRSLVGFLPKAIGQILVAGLDPRKTAPSLMAHHRSYCPQKPISAWNYRLHEMAAISGDAQAFEKWLHALGADLPSRRALFSLSGGEQKCAYLALTFAALGDPFGKVLFLDEPDATLDFAKQSALRQTLISFAHAGAAVIATTHDLRFARQCDHVLVLSEGRHVAAGDPEEALSDRIIADVWGSR